MGLELGLHRRTLKKSQTEVFKIDVARILHSKLANRNSSWDQFAHVVVGDVNIARRAYAASSARFNDEEVQHLLALDALLLVVLFKFVNGKQYFLKEFEALAGGLEEFYRVTDKADFFLIDNQVPMYLLQSVIRQLCEIDEETEERRVSDPTFQVLESKVEDELEKILNAFVLHLSPFTYPEISTNVSLRGCLSGSFCSQEIDSQNSEQRMHQHLISTYPVEPLEKSLINCQNLLDCLYRVICGHSLPYNVEPDDDSNHALETIPSVTRLEEVGIRVVGTVPTLRDIRLSGRGYLRSAELQLPKVELYDYSESAFHNLALHEHSAYGVECGDLRCYLRCMASLCIDVSDLQVLSEKGVMNCRITNKDTLSGMWDRTLRGVLTPFPSSTWAKCYRRILQHRRAPLKRWRRECWTLFFAKPWTLVSVLAAVILLFLTASQTWFTAFPP
jgi:hypothetical protein